MGSSIFTHGACTLVLHFSRPDHKHTHIHWVPTYLVAPQFLLIPITFSDSVTFFSLEERLDNFNRAEIWLDSYFRSKDKVEIRVLLFAKLHNQSHIFVARYREIISRLRIEYTYVYIHIPGGIHKPWGIRDKCFDIRPIAKAAIVFLFVRRRNSDA